MNSAGSTAPARTLRRMSTTKAAAHPTRATPWKMATPIASEPFEIAGNGVGGPPAGHEGVARQLGQRLRLGHGGGHQGGVGFGHLVEKADVDRLGRAGDLGEDNRPEVAGPVEP